MRAFPLLSKQALQACRHEEYFQPAHISLGEAQGHPWDESQSVLMSRDTGIDTSTKLAFRFNKHMQGV